ncbi:MAG: hypothetical protein ATN32_03995 [Candidatus Epulonipiscium fishelsonii]|nr:MAG: hypothetical protein ATN32_03995 [Epulopiscium sp. AS2M-Bin002]
MCGGKGAELFFSIKAHSNRSAAQLHRLERWINGLPAHLQTPSLSFAVLRSQMGHFHKVLIPSSSAPQCPVVLLPL